MSREMTELLIKHIYEMTHNGWSFMDIKEDADALHVWYTDTKGNTAHVVFKENTDRRYRHVH